MSGKYYPENNHHRENPFLTVLAMILEIFYATFKTLAVLGIVTVLAGGGFAWHKFMPVVKGYEKEVADVVDRSDLDTFRLQETSYIYDAKGDALAKLTGDEDSSYLSYEDIPKSAVNAFVAVEDRTFWENPGIDVKGIARVIVHYLRSTGDEMHGASTITQQLARNRFLTREVSLERKIKEMIMARDLTKKYSKEQIMEFYINDINYGNYFYGLEAAAKGYFGKNAKDLTLSQICYLCAIPNSPTYYNPYNHPERALERRDKILDDMKDCGFISEEECKQAKNEQITVARQKVPLHNYETTYAIDCAVRYLMEKDGFSFQYGFRNKQDYKDYVSRYNEAYEQERNALYTGGYSIYTSLDPSMQLKLQDAVDSTLSFSDKTSDNGIYAFQGAATAVDNATGKVVAIVGGRTQDTTTYTLNRAFQSYRQPGSTIKPVIVYTPALENGWTSGSMVTDIDVSEAKVPGTSVRELSGDTMTLRRAVERSRNGVASSVYDSLTPDLGLAYLTQMRFDNIVPDDYNDATALGGFTYGVTTEEMAGAYSAIANHGEYHNPTCIVKLIDNSGNDVFKDPEGSQVYQRESADVMVDIMKGVITDGTASSMGWDSDVEAAGKTGTTNGSKDGWFCGVTPYYTIAVWVGYDQPKELSNLYGATYPAAIWKKGMSGLVEGKAAATFDKPSLDKGYGTGTYLASLEDSAKISDGYTVRQFRSDHVLADEALQLLDSYYNGDGGDTETDRAENLIDSIRSDSMKLRLQDILKRGNPGKSSRRSSYSNSWETTEAYETDENGNAVTRDAGEGTQGGAGEGASATKAVKPEKPEKPAEPTAEPREENHPVETASGRVTPVEVPTEAGGADAPG